MAKEKLVKCPYCKEELSKDDGIKYGSRYFHSDCLKKKESEMDAKQKKAHEYKSLIEYICDLYKIQAPTGMILKQIKDFHDNYGYRLKGIELALKYFHETLGNPVQEGSGIGIVVYVYEDAKNHFILKKKVEKSVEEFDGDCAVNIIRVKSPKFNLKKKKIDKIDINEL